MKFRSFTPLGLIALMTSAVFVPPSAAYAGQRQRNDPQQLVRLNFPVPKLTGEDKYWLNSDGKPIAFKKGTVYIVHFWTFGCINCQRNLPSYAKWAKRYAKQNVTFIGVHTPETNEEKEFSNVTREVKSRGITYPVLFDPKSENWTRWQQQYWPTVYLIDKQGKVRYYWMGELESQNAGGEAIMERFIDQLLREPYTRT